MKNRFVPNYLFTTFFGLSLLLCSVFSMAARPGNPDPRKSDDSRLERIRANQFTGTVNPQDVFYARQQAEDLQYKSTGSGLGLKWAGLGPDNFTGLVWSAIFDNTDPSGLTIVSGASNGGIWKSADLGLTWTQMAVINNLVPRVSSIVQAPNGTIFAATGVTTCKSIKYSGNGLYRSSGGAEFSLVPGILGNPEFDGVSKLAVNQQNGKLYAATFGGLYVSDNGDFWTKVLPGYAMDVCVGSDGTVLVAVGDSAYLAPGGDFNARITLTTGKPNALPSVGIGWMVFAVAPSDANVMYASVAAADGKLFNVYGSTDKGATWSVVFPNNPTFEPFSGYGCYSNTLAVFPNDPFKVLLGGRNMWLGRRVQTSGYYNWEQVSFGTFGSYSPYFAPLYHHSYCFRPNNPTQLVMATDGGVSVATVGETEVLYQTSNKNLVTSQFSSLAFSAQKGYVMGGGTRIGTLALGYFYPSEVSFATNGFQVWRTDASALSANQQPQPANYCGTGGTCVWSSIDSKVAIYTKTGSQKIRRQDFTDINYYFNFAAGVKCDSTGNTPMRLWETFNQGKVFGITRDSVKYYAEFDTIPAETTVMVRSGSNGFMFPYKLTESLPKGDSVVVADPIASRYFIYGDTSNNVKGIFMTKDALNFRSDPVYYQIFKDVVTNDPVTALAVSEDLNTLWAGTSKGRLIRITGIQNAYDSLTASYTSSQFVMVDTVYTNTPFTGRFVTSISMHPNNANLVLVTLGNYGNDNYVYYAQNGNDASPVFNSIQSNLPKAPVFSGLLEMTGTNNVILGTDLGVFSAANLSSGTPEWTSDMMNIGNVAATEIRQQVIRDYHILNYGVIYLSSYGRGLWLDSTYAAPVGIEPVYGNMEKNVRLNVNPNPVKDVVTISYVNEVSGDLTLSVYDLTGRMLINTQLSAQPKGLVSTSLNISGLSHGTYIVKLGNGQGKIVKL